MNTYCRKDNKPADFTCVWKLENIGITFDSDSPTMTAQAIDRTKWKLKIYCGIAGPILLFISRKKDDGPNRVNIKFELSFIGMNGLPLIKEIGEKQFLRGDHFVFPKFADEYYDFIERRPEFLPKGELTIRCRMWKVGTETSKSDLYFARTIFETDRSVADLTIENFTSLQVSQVKKFLLNPPSKKDFKLTLQFYITEKNDEEFLSVNLKYNGVSWYNIKICILDFEKKVVHTDEKSGTFCCSFFDFFKRNELIYDEASLLPNDALTLRCEIEGQPKTVWNGIENYRFDTPQSLVKQMRGLHFVKQDETSTVPYYTQDSHKILQEEEKISNATLRTNSEPDPAHKYFRNVRNQGSKVVLNGCIKERTCNRFRIADFDEEILRKILSNIMCAVAELQFQNEKDLYRATNRHERLELKRKCFSSLQPNFSANRVFNAQKNKRHSLNLRYATKHGIFNIRFLTKRLKN